MGHNKRQTQDQKNNAKISQVSECLTLAAKYCNENNFSRAEDSVLNALTNLKELKEYPNAELLSEYKKTISAFNEKLRNSHQNCTHLEEPLLAAAAEVLNLQITEMVPDLVEE